MAPKPSRNCMSGLRWQLRPEPGYTSPLICSSPSHHPSSNLLVHKQYFQQHPPKPSQEIYLAVEGENEYFTLDLADQLPTSCCCILCLVRDNTQMQPSKDRQDFDLLNNHLREKSGVISCPGNSLRKNPSSFTPVIGALRSSVIFINK